MLYFLRRYATPTTLFEQDGLSSATLKVSERLTSCCRYLPPVVSSRAESRKSFDASSIRPSAYSTLLLPIVTSREPGPKTSRQYYSIPPESSGSRRSGTQDCEEHDDHEILAKSPNKARAPNVSLHSFRYEIGMFSLTLPSIKGLGVEPHDPKLKEDAWQQYNLTLKLLNESLGTCLV